LDDINSYERHKKALSSVKFGRFSFKKDYGDMNKYNLKRSQLYKNKLSRNRMKIGK